MNERIHKLAKEIGFPMDLENPPWAYEQDIYNFAELIVRECADLVASRPYIDDGNWSHPSTMIKEHFGVEE